MTNDTKSKKLWLCEYSDMECSNFVAIFDDVVKANNWILKFKEDSFHIPSITEIEINREYSEDDLPKQSWAVITKGVRK